ncbi:hypothetical protein OH77DRAFT_1421272 [Trametes cingulata]|nr:hypothetical protein OH77DRAFT_1421272 [Trametes cingulata]
MVELRVGVMDRAPPRSEHIAKAYMQGACWLFHRDTWTCGQPVFVERALLKVHSSGPPTVCAGNQGRYHVNPTRPSHGSVMKRKVYHIPPLDTAPDLISRMVLSILIQCCMLIDVLLMIWSASQVNASSKSTKSKGKQKQKKGGKKSGGKSTGFVELLFRGFLLWFTIYTLSVCPEDEQLKSRICRGLHEYRRLVIEPYIIPPIQHALAHPSVAPYVEKAKPYADYAVRTAKPIAARAQKEFDARVVPQWNKRVIPLYNQYAVPQLMKLDAQTAPYRSRAEQEYERYLGPYVRHAVATLNQWQHKARPYVVLAAQKTYDGYQRARPYARPVWEKVKVLVAQLLVFLGEQRRQFVDPHVKKIWEHVKELSGKPQAPSASQVRNAASSQLSKASSQVSKASVKVSSTLASVASSAVSGTTAIPDSTATDDVLPSVSDVPELMTSSEIAPAIAQTSEAVKSSVSVAAAKASSVVSSGSDALKSTASVISAAVSPSLSSVVSAASDTVSSSASSLASAAGSAARAPLEAASSVIPDVSAAVSSLGESATGAVRDAGSALSSAASSATDAAASSVSSGKSIASSASEEASVTVTQALAPVADYLSSIVSAVAEPDPKLFEKLSDPDLEAFKAELGLAEDLLLAEPVAASSSVAAAPPEETETEEEKEARLRARREKNAKNREELERRHSEWERMLAERISANKKALRKALVALRKAAAAELKENTQVRKEIEDLVEDAEKFLRGAEKYMANLQKEGRANEEKKAIWARVISKVEDKFTERLHQTEAVVNGWYQGVLDQELAEVKKVTDEVKDIVDRAQADIGLDYAYLDDVTYMDWQRYHDLARKGDNFTAHVQSVQDGTHPSPPINPVLPAIQEIQNEVEDVVAGFQTRLRRINRNGARAFGTPEEASDEESPETGDETVSILPIEESALPEHTQSPADVEVPPVVIGRGKEEVEAALNRVADLEGGKTSSPGDADKLADSDAVEQSLKQEIVGEETSAPPPPPLHQEL